MKRDEVEALNEALGGILDTERFEYDENGDLIEGPKPENPLTLWSMSMKAPYWYESEAKIIKAINDGLETDAEDYERWRQSHTIAKDYVMSWNLQRLMEGKEATPEALEAELDATDPAELAFAVKTKTRFSPAVAEAYFGDVKVWDTLRKVVEAEAKNLLLENASVDLVFHSFTMNVPAADIAFLVWYSWILHADINRRPLTAEQFKKDWDKWEPYKYRLILFYAEISGIPIEGNKKLENLARVPRAIPDISPLVATNKMIHLKSKVAQATQEMTTHGSFGIKARVKVFGDKDPKALTEIMITTPRPLKDMLAPQLDDETWLIHDALLSLKEYGGNDGITFTDLWKFLTKNDARPAKDTETYLENHLIRLAQTWVDIKADSEINPEMPRKDGVIRFQGYLFPLDIITAIVRGKPVRYVRFLDNTPVLGMYTDSMTEPQKQLIPAGYWALYDLDPDGRRLKTTVRSTKRRRIIITYLLYEIFDRRADLKSGTRRHDLNNCIILTTHTNSRGRTIDGLYDKLDANLSSRETMKRINADIETVLRNWMPAALEGLPDTPPLIYGYSFGKSAHDEPALFLDWSSPERKKALEEAAKKPQRRPRKKKDAQQ